MCFSSQTSGADEISRVVSEEEKKELRFHPRLTGFKKKKRILFVIQVFFFILVNILH